MKNIQMPVITVGPYIISDPNNTTSAGFDDDGEPNGTAGRPILNVLQHKSIGNVIIIVVRYFGGIKLGAGEANPCLCWLGTGGGR